ncbi:MAG: S24 family peptidase [Saprospiraceae bacterium]
MNSFISQRFIDCFEELLTRKSCRSARHFATSIGIAPQALNEILKYRREVNIEIIEKANKIYNFNTNFLFSGDGPKFLKEDYSKDFSILTIVANSQNEEYIIHVPIQAQAGYSGRYIDPVFIQSLPNYQLPFQKFKTDSTMRSYEVDGDSMEPIIYKGDIVVSSYMHSFIWEKNLKEGPLYVIVTNSDVLVKRITNRMREERKLILHSDNEAYPSFSVKIEEIKEIWQVRAKISSQLDKIKKPTICLEEDIKDLKLLLNHQSSILENLVDKLEV